VARLFSPPDAALTIEKGGFPSASPAPRSTYPLAYGLVCLALSLFTGWFAGVIFRRP